MRRLAPRDRCEALTWRQITLHVLQRVCRVEMTMNLASDAEGFSGLELCAVKCTRVKGRESWIQNPCSDEQCMTEGELVLLLIACEVALDGTR